MQRVLPMVFALSLGFTPLSVQGQPTPSPGLESRRESGMQFQVTRAHLKKAVEESNWDLLDKLLEIDSSAIDDNKLFTDTWGQWWGLLITCVAREQTEGVRVLLKHGANPQLATWGDCDPTLPLSLAQEKKNVAIQRLLSGADGAVYQRRTDPPLPPLTASDQAVNRQGSVAESTGLVFPSERFLDPPSTYGVTTK